jgi:8-oxo-dGTP diphosphatase
MKIIKKPQIGLGIFTINHSQDKILLGIRRKEAKYGLPGGRLEYLETFEECASRELYEETNIQIKDSKRFKLFCYFNVIDKTLDYHWVNFDLYVNLSKNEEVMLNNREKENFISWEWVDIGFLHTNRDKLFLPLGKLLDLTGVKNVSDIVNYNNMI